MDGIGKTMPVTMFAFFIGSLSIIGLPPFGGSWSKWYLALGAAEAHQFVFVAVLMISSLLSIAYLMPIVARAFFLAPSTAPANSSIREAPMFCVVPLCMTAAGCLVLFFFADDIYRLLEPIAQP
jgi:multicomponent Na+:H+ antiporter subunit D